MIDKNTTQFKKRTRRIKSHLKKNCLKMSILTDITGKPRGTISYILNGKRYPKFTNKVLAKIENHFNLN